MGGMQISSWGMVDGSWGRAASFTLFVDGAYGIILLMKEKYMTSPSRPSALLKAGPERSYIILGMKQTYFSLGMDLSALVEMTGGLVGTTKTFTDGVLKRVQDDVGGLLAISDWLLAMDWRLAIRDFGDGLRLTFRQAQDVKPTGSQFKIGMTVTFMSGVLKRVQDDVVRAWEDVQGLRLTGSQFKIGMTEGEFGMTLSFMSGILKRVQDDGVAV